MMSNNKQVKHMYLYQSFVVRSSRHGLRLRDHLVVGENDAFYCDGCDDRLQHLLL